MTLETLYKRTKNNKIQSWKIMVADLEPVAQIVTEQGNLGGKQQTYYDDVLVGKNIGRSNKTTALQQAESEAESKWRKKKDEGYKSLSDLDIVYKGMSPDNKPVYSSPSGIWYLNDCLESHLPKENTDANNQVKPMLAQPVKKDFSNVQFPCIVQPKLDGVRCLCIISFNENSISISFLSRSGKDYTTLRHIATDIRKLDLTDDMILDGEIYSDEITFQQITSAVKKVNENTSKLKFRVYDIVSEETQFQRLHKLSALLKGKEDLSIERVPSIININNPEQLKKKFADYIADGYEGLMVRDMKGVYQSGSRSKYLLKYKEFDTDEFVFDQWELGKRGVEDLIAVCRTKDGTTFRAKMQGTRKEKEELFETYTSTGGLLTVRFFGYTDDGSVRFPIGIGFRDYE